MPEPSEILRGLHTIANTARSLAVGWHVIGWLVALRIALGWRPSRRLMAMALSLPLLSVVALASKAGNPFNGIVLTGLVLALAGTGMTLPSTAADRSPRWARALGAALMVYGLVYPHFLDAGSWVEYLYAAPTGLVPCPTLSFVIGVALALDGFGSRRLSLALVANGIFYGAFGIFGLGVVLDIGLLAGALGLLLLGVSGRRANRPANSDWSHHV